MSQMRFIAKYGLVKWGLVLVQYHDTVNDDSAHHLQDSSFTQVHFSILQFLGLGNDNTVESATWMEPGSLSINRIDGST